VVVTVLDARADASRPRGPVAVADPALAEGRHARGEKLRAGASYQDRGLVFAGERGGIINPSNLRNRSFVPLLRNADLPRITFHDLRHTCASLLFQRNVHPKFVQELLGHASVAIILDTYSHMLPGMGGEAADAMDKALG
jgi:integrase